MSVAGETAQVLSGGRVKIAVGDDDQLLTYTVTDQDGLTASAFIHVPSLTSLPPSLMAAEGITVKSGETVELPLNEYVRVSRGGGAVITEAEKVTAIHGDGADLVKDQHTLVYTSASRYAGPDALTFEVTDGTGPDDVNGHKATLVLPITVTPPDNVQADVHQRPDEGRARRGCGRPEPAGADEGSGCRRPHGHELPHHRGRRGRADGHDRRADAEGGGGCLHPEGHAGAHRPGDLGRPHQAGRRIRRGRGDGIHPSAAHGQRRRDR
ncbi:cadherin-like domain-containing protein [Microbacterium elymi]|uniref:Cadherin-like domain-containing protein n=1 Tax=Microbacterium elymi TaxID=2909587 RepID=A0ABY5NH29_9MICO|nr:cadherin-like domain-containing protein [Microbacterium elymi]UUT34467.1 cadherin-like domain-containing protein [Microbacterium elymi]